MWPARRVGIAAGTRVWDQRQPAQPLGARAQPAPAASRCRVVSLSREAFVAVPIVAGAPMSKPKPTNDSATAVRMWLQARLPNGVVIDLRECGPHQAGEVIEALGRVRCSASTKP